MTAADGPMMDVECPGCQCTVAYFSARDPPVICDCCGYRGSL